MEIDILTLTPVLLPCTRFCWVKNPFPVHLFFDKGHLFAGCFCDHMVCSWLTCVQLPGPLLFSRMLRYRYTSIEKGLVFLLLSGSVKIGRV